MNTYRSFDEASDSNWKLLIKLFKKSKKFKLIEPFKKNSIYDGVLLTKKNNKQIIILVEVKRRQFTQKVLADEYKNTLFLEKSKYENLHKQKEKFESLHKDAIVKVWYLSKTTDGFCYIHNITNRDFTWISTKMNNVTYSPKKQKTNKKVALLNTSDAILTTDTHIKK